jgi:hypothetical protein
MICYPWGWLAYFWCRTFHKTTTEELDHGGSVTKCRTCWKHHIRR